MTKKQARALYHKLQARLAYTGLALERVKPPRARFA
jgi:hypothetical protein